MHTPERTCMGCNAKKEKQSLVRIVKSKEMEVILDETGKLSGRGAYICKDIECLEKVIKNRRLERALKTKIDETTYEDLRRKVIG